MTAASRRLVTFGVGSALYAADISAVERVLRVEEVHPVPGMPEWMEGVIDHAGRVVPVVDLRRRLSAPGSATGEDAQGGRLLVLACAGEVLAARVDRVLDVRSVAPGDIAPAPALVQDVAGDFVLGVTRRDGVMTFVLDVPRLFTPQERDTLRQAAGACEPARRHESVVA